MSAAGPDAATPHPLLQWLDGGGGGRSDAFPCAYLPGRLARQRGFRADGMPGELYHELMDRGFRRSGDLFYAMVCDACRSCVPLRVPVATFAPSRSQRRTMQRNRDVTVVARQPQCTSETFAMYRRYLQHQHPSTPVTENEAEFRESLYAEVVDSVEMVYSLGDRPIAISLLDVCERSVSAVYHFYEPEFAARSLGVFSVLMEIEYARRLGIPHYYLGYWIEGAETMAYKANYRPHELLRDGSWRAPG